MLHYHERYADDRPRMQALLDLLAGVFRTDDLSRWVSLGFRDSSFVARSFFDSDECVANVTTLQLALVVAGAPCNAVGISSVATHPDYRRRGLFQELMRRTIAEARADTTLLFTHSPQLYEPFGFRVVHDDVFRRRCAARPFLDAAPARRLGIERDADVALVRECVGSRAPVSQRLGVCGAASLFFYNEIRHDLGRVYALDEWSALAVVERDRLLDLVTRSDPPPIDAVVASLRAANAIGGDGAIEIAFTPDPLLHDGGTSASPRSDGDFLMVRGPFPIERETFAFPPTAYL